MYLIKLKLFYDGANSNYLYQSRNHMLCIELFKARKRERKIVSFLKTYFMFSETFKVVPFLLLELIFSVKYSIRTDGEAIIRGFSPLWTT